MTVVEGSSCACGRKSKIKESNCVRGTDNSRCSCVIKGTSCTRKCRCRTCQNKDPNQDEKKVTNSRGCRCGINKMGDFQSCTDVDGQRRTRCPCFLNSLGCTDLCSCSKCHNPFSRNQVMETDVKKRASRKRPRHSSYTTTRGQEFLQNNDSEAAQGPWTTLEACMLQTVESFLGTLSNVQVTSKNHAKLYNFEANTEKAKELGLQVRQKSENQIQAKILSLSKMKQAFSNLFSPCL